MDTLKIKLFLLVEKHKNFSEIAKEFSYTPSAISHMADALEDELGVKLFIRTNKGVDLTDDGIKLYDKFLSMENAEKELLKEASSLIMHNRYLLRIGAYSSIALHFLPSILQSFKKEYPLVKTTIKVDDYMQDWIKNGVVDVILADELIGSSMWQPLLDDEYVAVVLESEFPEQEEINVEDLYAHTFIKPDEENLKNYIDYTRFNDIIEVKSIENNSVIYMVKEKLGITVLPELSIKALPDGVKALKLTPKITRTIGIIYDKKQPLWACERFVRHIKKEIKLRGDG